MSRRIFVTGATGVIGSRVVRLLISSGHSVSAVGRTAEKRATLAASGAHAVAVDAFDAAAVRHALDGHDTVINLATHMPSSSFRMMLPWAWRENDRVRREGAAILAGAATAVGAVRFMQESFAPVYEGAGDRWIDECFPIRPARYNRSVIDAESAAAEFTRRGGAGMVLRFAGFYGSDAVQVADYVKIVRMGWSPLPGPPNAYVSSIAHDDAASAVVALLDAPAGIYNVTDDEPVTHREFAGSLARALRVAPPKFPPAWTARLMGSIGELLSRSQRMSNRTLRDATGWTPKYRSVREGWASVL
jgi:nucleoside-diphosphate-sugar epimerase